MRIIGILLILLGLLLFASPRILYSRREKIIDTESVHVTAERQKSTTIPAAISLAAVGAGVVILILAGRKSQ